jgi:hypothetical protein
LLISNIDIDIDTIDRYFWSIDIGIDNTFMSGYRERYRRYFWGLFLPIFRYRYFWADVNKISIQLITKRHKLITGNQYEWRHKLAITLWRVNYHPTATPTSCPIPCAPDPLRPSPSFPFCPPRKTRIRGCAVPRRVRRGLSSPFLPNDFPLIPCCNSGEARWGLTIIVTNWDERKWKYESRKGVDSKCPWKLNEQIQLSSKSLFQVNVMLPLKKTKK